METLPVQDFDRAWLWRVTSPDGYFSRDVRQVFVDEDAGRDPELVAEFRSQLAAERAAIAAVWRDGDELWEWRNERLGPKLEAMDSVGEMGIAVIRIGRVVAVWATGTWA